MRFIDEVKVDVRAGNGGAGSRSFRRERYIPKGGPDGGNGGRGGHVLLCASRDKNTLQELYLRKHIIAENGKSGAGRKMYGRNGADITMTVPVGTIVKDEDGHVLFDLNEDGQTVVIAHGGIGGLGNSNFVSSTNRAPHYAQSGMEGDAGLRFLELKSMADVGLVGLPNAGKSTFISSVSNARPKIADYPFTTIAPSLGQVFMDDGDGFVLADIPGLIAGAHEGKGLGHRFLRHVERTRVLLHLVDVAHPEGRSITEQVHEIEEELKGYGDSIWLKKRFLVLNKMDALAEDGRQSALDEAKGINSSYYAVSAVTGEGVQALLYDLYAAVKSAHADELAIMDEEKMQKEGWVEERMEGHEES